MHISFLSFFFMQRTLHCSNIGIPKHAYFKQAYYFKRHQLVQKLRLQGWLLTGRLGLPCTPEGWCLCPNACCGQAPQLLWEFLPSAPVAVTAALSMSKPGSFVQICLNPVTSRTLLDETCTKKECSGVIKHCAWSGAGREVTAAPLLGHASPPGEGHRHPGGILKTQKMWVDSSRVLLRSSWVSI